MTTLTLDLPTDLYERLHAVAVQQCKPVETIVRDLIEERLPPDATNDRDAARETLRAAGLLAELGPEMKKRVAR